VKSIKFVQDPVDCTLTTVAASGINDEVYPKSKLPLVTLNSNGVEKESASESKLKGPESAPAIVNVMVAVFGIKYNYITTNPKLT
jgi:hypothetical protein